MEFSVGKKIDSLSVENDGTKQILIEGDNLPVMRKLIENGEKFDIIYLDPPYNSGKGFRYFDRFKTPEEWISFMRPRLECVKELMVSSGVVFVSIDERSLAYLRILGDEIFGSENFVRQLVWVKTHSPSNLSNTIRDQIDYILVWTTPTPPIFYGPQKSSFSDNPTLKPQNAVKTLTFPAGAVEVRLKNNVLPGMYGTKSYTIELLDELIIEEGRNKNPFRLRSKFIWTQETLQNQLESGINLIIKRPTLVLSYDRENYIEQPPSNLLDENVGVGTNEQGAKELSDMGIYQFNHPKPLSLMRYILNLTRNKKAKILDPFAGSGSTCHAAMQLNDSDNGAREVVLITNNENEIAREVCAPRIHAALKGYKPKHGNYIKGIENNSFSFYGFLG